MINLFLNFLGIYFILVTYLGVVSNTSALIITSISLFVLVLALGIVINITKVRR